MDERNRRTFGHMPDGTAVEEVTLRDGAFSCGIITYAGAVRWLTVPDRNGDPVDVALGFDSLEDYHTQHGSLGALVGRYANRIGGARFTLGGQEYTLPANNGPNHCHGGPMGYNHRVWTVESLTDNAVTLILFSPDGEAGYPGNLTVWVTYTLRDGALEIEYRAKTDKPTVCNLTNHTYFNLSGHDSGPVTEQYIQLCCERYTPVAAGSIPTGAIEPVEGTPMDLRTPQPMLTHADDPFDQLEIAGGYDHNWVVDGWDGQLKLAAKAWSPDTGISLETWTTLPGVQFYTANSLSVSGGKGGAPYAKRWGFCLETQYFPDAPNHSNFPSAALDAGEEYFSKTIYRFGVTDRP